MSDIDTDTDTGDYAAQVRQEREEKDEFFGEHPRSPIPGERREGFDGLSYYDVDPALRFEVELEPFDDPEEITVETTQDGQQTYLEAGTFELSVGGETVTLTAFRPPGGEGRLWLPFRDATSGEETYPAGRYLDLEEPDDRTETGAWVVDFNRAYNPFCAYADAYECPLVPTDNWLDVPVRAGERAPST